MDDHAPKTLFEAAIRVREQATKHVVLGKVTGERTQYIISEATFHQFLALLTSVETTRNKFGISDE